MKYTLSHQTARDRAIEAIRNAPDGYVVTIKEPKRSLEANAALWAALTDISKQVDWYGNKLTKEEWKDVLSASLKRQKVVPSIDGGFVVMGMSTSRMSKAELSDLLELIKMFGSNQGVKWSH